MFDSKTVVILVVVNIFRSSSEAFGNLWLSSEMFGKCLETFVWPSDNFWRIFRIFWKIVRNVNEQNNTRVLVDMEYLFSCST